MSIENGEEFIVRNVVISQNIVRISKPRKLGWSDYAAKMIWAL